MSDALHSLNYVHVVVVAIIGFAFGAIWYSGALFGKAWMAEMKISPETERPSMAPFMLKGFIFTLISTWGLALLVADHRAAVWTKGACYGAMIGLLIVGARKLNSGVWERTSCKLSSINVAHETLLFAIQGAILAVWR